MTKQFALLVLTMLCWTAPAAAQIPIFFRDSSYNGAAAQLQPGFYNTAAMVAWGIPDNSVSSVMVPPGFLLEIFNGDNFTGTKVTLNSPWADLYYGPGGVRFNDRMSSVKVYGLDQVALSSMTSEHNYVTAARNGLDPLIASQNRIGLLETFRLVSLGNRDIALKSLANSKYVSADNAGASPLIANRDDIGTWDTTFNMVPLGDNRIALWSYANGKYVTAESDGQGALIANRDAVGQWETFELVQVRTVSQEPTLAPDMVYVDGGSMFIQGRDVTLTAFEIGQYEVSYELWYSIRKWGEANGYTFRFLGREWCSYFQCASPAGRAPTEQYKQHPVAGISWTDVIVWANALSEKEGLTPPYTYNGQVVRNATNTTACANATSDWFGTGYRLPTIAEWEYAARGGRFAPDIDYHDFWRLENWTWWNGNSYLNSPDGYRANQTVGTKWANGLGIYDMVGNVSEFCWDWLADPLSLPSLDPATPPGGFNYKLGEFYPTNRRIVMGGNFICFQGETSFGSCSTSKIDVDFMPNTGDGLWTGFRLVKRYE